MNLMRMTLAAAAALMLTASLAGACGEKKSEATGASAQMTSGGHAGCASKAGKAHATTVSGSGCAAKAAGGGCAKGKAMAAGGGCADKAKAGGCCAKGQAVMASVGDTSDAAACKFKAGAVAFKGTVLCNHCDLKKSETCATMFKTDGGCLFALSGDKAKELREAAVGGSKLVRIKGDVTESGDLVVTTFRVVRTLDSGASAM